MPRKRRFTLPGIPQHIARNWGRNTVSPNISEICVPTPVSWGNTRTDQPKYRQSCFCHFYWEIDQLKSRLYR